jgi:lipopolysaccharide export LptBFGC system permease protein LptF
MNSQFMYTFFGPLSKQYCNYFLFLAMIFFLLLVLTILFQIFDIVKHFKTLKTKDYVSSFVMIMNLLLAYFVNRLLFTMCIS